MSLLAKPSWMLHTQRIAAESIGACDKEGGLSTRTAFNVYLFIGSAEIPASKPWRTSNSIALSIPQHYQQRCYQFSRHEAVNCLRLLISAQFRIVVDVDSLSPARQTESGAVEG